MKPGYHVRGMPILSSICLSIFIAAMVFILPVGADSLYRHPAMNSPENTIMAEGYSLSTQVVSRRDLDESRKNHRDKVEAYLNDPGVKKIRERAYQTLYGVSPDAVLKLPCDLGAKFGPRGINISLESEWHNDKQAHDRKSVLLNRANNGELALLTESDMAPTKDMSPRDLAVLRMGLARSAQALGSSESNPRFVYAIDDARVRALSLEQPNDSERELRFVTEVFRNPVLRRILAAIKREDIELHCKIISRNDSLSVCALNLQNQIRTLERSFKQLDEKPGADLSKQRFSLEDLRLWMLLSSKANLAYPDVDQLSRKHSSLLIDLRDHAMSQNVLDRLCVQVGDVRDFHVAIGFLHTEGMKARLERALSGVKVLIVDKNASVDIPVLDLQKNTSPIRK